MPEDIYAVFRQLCMLAGVVVWYLRKRKHSKARHSMAPHAGHDNAWAPHGAAPRRAVELSKLNGAGGWFFRAFRYTQLGAGCDTKKT